jgi:YVTN family beta-propeller protein
VCRASLVTVAFLLLGSVAPAAAVRRPARRDVVFVANAEDGTVSVLDARTFRVIKTLDVIPDGERPSPAEDPVHFLSSPLVVAAAGTNLAQDLDVSPDGRTLYVSRGHRGDVAAFDIASGAMWWRAAVGGFRADHMTLSEDGRRLFVSALTENEVEVLDAATGRFVGSFPTGEWPHDNEVSPDGRRVYNGSLGNILVPPEVRDRPDEAQPLLGPETVITVADARSLEVLRTIPFRRGVRPFVITRNERRLYAQLSELHGLVEVEVRTGRTLRTLDLPVNDGVTSDDYDFEAPHHGLALSPDQRYLCVAGRASDYVAIVSTRTLRPVRVLPVDDAPGWAENTPDGRHCVVASTRADTVTVVSYRTLRVVATIEVGDGPKHVAAARVPASVLRSSP